MKFKTWHKQFIRFGSVGVAATTVHVLFAFALLDNLNFSLLAANVSAFFAAFFVSYFGNALWSFESRQEMKSLLRFFVASGINLSVIVIISNWVTDTELPVYTGILLVAMVIPIIGFIVQKFWVFRRF